MFYSNIACCPTLAVLENFYAHIKSGGRWNAESTQTCKSYFDLDNSKVSKNISEKYSSSVKQLIVIHRGMIT